jgi:hypothetical protein
MMRPLDPISAPDAPRGSWTEDRDRDYGVRHGVDAQGKADAVED